MSAQIPIQCAGQKAAVDRLNSQIQELQGIIDALEQGHAHDTETETEIRNNTKAKSEAQKLLVTAQRGLSACVKLNSGPAFAPDPFSNPARPDGISTEGTLITRTQVVPLDFLQKKFDEFFNNRPGDPIFRLRFDNDPTEHTDPPRSFAEFLIIVAAPTPGTGTPLETTYHSLGTVDLGQLADYYYFQDINSNSIKVKFFMSDPAPLKVTIGFETDGPVDMPGLIDLDFLEFDISINFTLGSTELDLLSWMPEYKSLMDRITSFGTTTGSIVTGSFLGKPVTFDGPFDPVKIAVIKEGFEDQIVDVHLTAAGSALRPGGAAQKRIRGNIFDKLADEGNRGRVNGYARRWVLGQDGGYEITAFHNDGQTISIDYRVPQSTLTPFSTNWPENTNLPPDPTLDRTTVTAPRFPPGTLEHIDHIIVLTMENRSFDQMVGYLSLPESQNGMGRTEVDGLNGQNHNFYNGTNYPSFPFNAGETVFAPDPEHDSLPVFHQIDDGKMDGFVKSYAEDVGSGTGDGSTIMGYHTAVNVPVFDALARDFPICHRWFAAHPGPTFCNRFFQLTGRLNLTSALLPSPPGGSDPAHAGYWEYTNSNPLTPVFTKTIFDYLTEHQVTWRYYEHFYCWLRFFVAHTFDTTNIFDAEDPFRGFFADAKGGTLPSVSFIDPHFIELPPNGNDDGPPADVKEGQLLVQRVVEAVVAGPKWQKSLLVIIYDEHGGFYDHVPPPAAAKITLESPVKTFGVRVPAFIISPWTIPGQQVFGHDDSPNSQGNLYFDHTSILKTIARRFMSASPPYMGARYAAAKDLSAVLGDTPKKSQFLPFIRYNIVYKDSQKALDIQGGIAAAWTAGSTLCQSDKSDVDTQNFSFEDAGDGFVYIRTHPANLYVTVVRQDDALTDGSVTTGTDPISIKQDVKYQPVGLIATGSKVNPALQKWKVTAAAGSVLNPENMFVISNALLSNKALQPVNNTAGVAVVLGDKSASTGTFDTPNTWHVSSPLISVGGDHL